MKLNKLTAPILLIMALIVVLVLPPDAKAFKDDFNNYSILPCIMADSSRATVVGNTIDLTNAQSCTFTINQGGVLGTLSASVYINWVLWESTDGTTWTACTNQARYIGRTLATADSGAIVLINGAAEDSLTYNFGFNPRYRYLRLTANFVGSHDDITTLSASVFMLKKVRGGF